ncbi:MAG: hypothetical protein ACTSPQ_18140, partial [Candidatus Helarchaeota archaeon]
AFNIGLLHEIYEEEEFFDKSIEFGKRISSKNIDLLRNMKDLIDRQYLVAIYEGLKLEHLYSSKWG